MWGSDYPPVSRREGYDNALRVPIDYLSGFSADDREWIFGKNRPENLAVLISHETQAKPITLHLSVNFAMSFLWNLNGI